MTWEPDYATTSQLKGWLRIADNVDDTELSATITAASRAIDRVCGRQFGQVAVAEARTFQAVYNRGARPGWELPIDDLGSIASLAVTIDGTAVTGYSLGPSNALSKGRVYTRLTFADAAEALPTASENDVVVTGLWGWANVPTTVLQATKMQTARFMARRDSPYGVAGSPDMGNELRLLAKVDPDVQLMLKPYVRRWWAS